MGRVKKLKREQYYKIFEMYLTLEKQTEIAKVFGLSKERVRQVIKNFTNPTERIAFKELKSDMRKEVIKKQNRAKYARKKTKMRKIARDYYYKKTGGRPCANGWSEKEDKILDQYYPICNTPELLIKLPKRTKPAIMLRASLRGIKKTYNL